MPEQITIDEEQLRQALATRPPQTKEEFFLYAKACRFPCESCKGTGKDLSPGIYGEVPCPRCNGEGKTGMHFGRTAVCPGHSAPLDVFWDMYSQQFRHAFIRANRSGGKTKGIAFTEHMMMHHRQFSIAHMGGSEAQANRGRDYFHAEVSVEPWSDMVATSEPGQTKVQFHNGGKIEWLPSTEKQASGPHPELSILDEMDEVDYNVRERFVKTPSGPRAMMIEASTWYGQEGTISRVRKENPGLVEKVFCLRGDSKIATPEGEIPIKDLVGRSDVWVYGIKDSKLALCRAENIRLTRRRAPVVRVRYYWVNNCRREGEIFVTPDHKFLLKSGEWKEAQHLSKEDRLVPFYRKRTDAKVHHQSWLVHIGGEPSVKEHRFVFEQINGRKLKEHEVVHHIDHNHWNNSPSNLQGMSDSKHKSYHQMLFAQDHEREAIRIEKLHESRRCSGSPWNREVNLRRWRNASKEKRTLWGERISQGLLGHKGWDTFRARYSEEEQKEYFKQRALKGVETRRRKRELARELKSFEIVSVNHRVISVEPADFADVYCMEVPDSKNFIANGVVVHNCLWETISRCDYDCDQMPLKDGTIGRCPLYEMEEPQSDGTVRVVELCGGKLARLSDGHISVPDAVASWERSNIHSRRVEHLCQEPSIPSGTRAYWAFSDQISPLGNVLPFDPPIRFDAPIDWTLDYNINPMASFIIQQAPPEYGVDELWIVDEIYLFTASTPHVCAEFGRRYGVGGVMLSDEGKETGIIGGLHIYGDWTGHNRSSMTLKSHYDIIQEMLGQTPGFQILVRPGDLAPPIDRLNLTNQMFWDLKSGSKRRSLKVAPRCVNGRREFAIMPMKVGTMEKDKSDRVQRQLGLSHLGDALECWVWKRFPRGPFPGPQQVAQLSGQRQAVPENLSIGGRRLTGTSSPWGNREDHGPWR